VAGGLGNTLTSANAVIYTLYMTDSTSDFYDITSAATRAVTARMKGYEAVTGLGTPMVSLLVNDLGHGHGDQYHGLVHKS